MIILHVVRNQKAWCNSKVIPQWINKVLKPIEPGKGKFLVVDSFRARIQLQKMLEYNPRIKVCYLPKIPQDWYNH